METAQRNFIILFRNEVNKMLFSVMIVASHFSTEDLINVGEDENYNVVRIFRRRIYDVFYHIASVYNYNVKLVVINENGFKKKFYYILVGNSRNLFCSKTDMYSVVKSVSNQRFKFNFNHTCV